MRFTIMLLVGFASTVGPLRVMAVEVPSTEMLRIRDPFKRPSLVESKDLSVRSELETFSADSLKMLGVITGPKKMKALIQSPSGHTYYVTEKTKVGMRGGVISKITINGMKIREKIVNVLGQEEDVETEIPLLPDADDKRR
jgi:Tfp pilus assembly protein PilP